MGNRDLVFFDDMTDPTSGWNTGDGDFASVSYDTGVLAFRYNQDKAWAYSTRDLDTSLTTTVQAVDFSPQSAGYFGLLCGNKASGTFFGAVVNTEGGLEIVKIEGTTITELEVKGQLGLDVTVGASNPMALQCSSDVDGVVSMIVGLSRTGPVAVYRQPGGGLDGFDVTGIYGEAASDSYTLTAASAAVWGAAPNGRMSSGALALFAHIPTDLQVNCFESPIWNTSSTYEVTCLEQVKDNGAEILQYQQFDAADRMNAAYQDLVTGFGVEPDPAQSCQSGPYESGRQVDGVDNGRVQCAPQFIGIRFDWTDEQLNILGTLVDLDGSYSDTYDQWIYAGPAS